MSINKYIVKNDISLRQAMQALDTASMKILFITDDDDQLKGALSDGDIRRWILKGNSLDAQVTKVMEKNPIILSQRNLQLAVQIMKEKRIAAIPVVENGKISDIYFWTGLEESKSQKLIDAKVVIMAGGKGERLMPYTSIVPKPLLPIGDRPISELVMDSFKKYGCKNYYFTLNYKKNMIKAYYDERKNEYDIKYIEEDEPLGTGGSLFYLKDQIDSTFFVSNCDILLDIDYADALSFHKEKSNLITIITSLKKYTVPYGIVNIGKDGQIESLIEKPSNDYLVNTGVYIIEPKILDHLDKKKFIHITDLIKICLQAGERIGTYPISEESWMDMGQFEDMERMKQNLYNKY